MGVKFMQPIDKFGQPIYQKIYSILKEQEKVLLECGYHESSKKPNLFLRTCRIVTFFADMRGTEIIPIWKDPSPMFYWNWRKENLEIETRSRAILIEWSRLSKANLRLSNECDRYEDIELLNKRFAEEYTAAYQNACNQPE